MEEENHDPTENQKLEGNQNNGEPQTEEVKEEKEETEHERRLRVVKERLEQPYLLLNKYGLKTTFQLGSETDKKEIFCCDYDVEDKYFAVGLSDGSVCIYNMMNSKLAQTISYSNPETGDPARCMCLKWREMDYINEVGVKRKQSMILCAYSDGVINEYISPVGKLSSTLIEEGNQTFVIDIDPLEEKFVTGGRDCKLRLYDLETKELIIKMIPVYSNHPGHSQAIFACTFK